MSELALAPGVYGVLFSLSAVLSTHTQSGLFRVVGMEDALNIPYVVRPDIAVARHNVLPGLTASHLMPVDT